MKPAIVLMLLGFCSLYIDGAAAVFRVNVENGGAYNIVVNNKIWLSSGDTAFNANGVTFSTSDGSLKVADVKTLNGSDRLGSWRSTSFLYEAGKHSINASVRVLSDPNISAAVFTQIYSDDVRNTSSNSSDGVISKFPSFSLASKEVELGYVAFAGNFAGYSRLSRGRFNEEADFRTGIQGGPLVIFDNSSNAIVISPLSKFMAASSNLEPKKQINWGIMGLVNDVPRGYEIDFIVVYSNKGINQAIKAWGNYLTGLYKKTTLHRENDLTIQYLGYWTDNGAYYYYHTEQGKDYETTMIDTVEHFKSLNIPFKYVQYDSWWYPKGKAQGTKTWEAQAKTFPHGFKYISDKIKLPIGCHNRYWSEDTTYAKYNGGAYSFIPDHSTGCSVPTDFKFWEDLFNKTQTWGQFILYEQDWLDYEIDHNLILRSNLTLGKQWLQQMGEAAEIFGITIQYCMAYGRHLLQSLEIPTVTQVRVSGDYQPGNHQWNIGITSILADALNVAPFKDTFYTTTNQTGNPYNRIEPNTRLQSLISTLSTGPVGPGDGIGFMDRSLIMKSCDSNGLLLKPAAPATAINDQIKRSAFGASYNGPAGEVYTTHTLISGSFFGIVVAAQLTNSYSLTPASAWPNSNFPPSVAFSENNPGKPFNFSNTAPIHLDKGCTTSHFCLYYTSPLFRLNDGETFAILGEVDKWVPMSHQRFRSIQKTANDIQVQLKVHHGEIVTFEYYNVNKNEAKSVVCDNSKSSTPALSSLISLVKGTCTVA